MICPVVVLTVDQRGSRRSPDLIPEMLTWLADVSTRVGFERTVGDEFQGVLDRGPALADTVERLLRADAWNIGVGIGPVEEPLPDHARAGRGPAYLHARTAVTAAKSSPWHTRVVGDDPAARALETTIWLWAAVLARRSSRGWEVADLVADGLSYAEVGERLGISQSAVSQRAQAAGIVEGRRARELVSGLTTHLLGEDRGHDRSQLDR
jgi:Sigma-70, region 4